MAERLIPTGKCWCGCGQEAGIGSFFLSGHDKKAESMLILVKYGGVAQFLTHHGYSPTGNNLRADYEEWERAGGKAR